MYVKGKSNEIFITRCSERRIDGGMGVGVFILFCFQFYVKQK